MLSESITYKVFIIILAIFSNNKASLLFYKNSGIIFSQRQITQIIKQL